MQRDGSAEVATALCALALALLAVQGCGGEDARAKSEFVERAGAICERSKQRADRAIAKELPRLGIGPPSGRQGRRILALALPHIRASMRRIAALEPVDGDAAEIEAYLSSYREATRELGAIAREPKRSAALMAGELEDPFAQADRMAGAYGIEKCSGDGA